VREAVFRNSRPLGRGMCACACACVCVRACEREREREIEREREYYAHTHTHTLSLLRHTQRHTHNSTPLGPEFDAVSDGTNSEIQILKRQCPCILTTQTHCGGRESQKPELHYTY
jgi:hypothetical protein